ncbi:MAG: tetratricopeptide repeat protein, partial [candidate division Zixibacteria bacterium]|nr:tetratricopeptide repeat protein [candidate division Zixibacteria bacterium]
ADSLYLAVNTNRLERAEKEELVFKRAQIKFFQKEYDQAKGLYQHLSGIYPRSLYVNDCLRKILIIDENQGMAILDLNFYSQAERTVWQNKIDSALARLVELSERGNSNLAALATFEAGKIYYDRGDYEKSFEMFTRMLESFEESFYSAESQRYIGDLYFYHFDNKQKAAEAYRLILENYPNRVLYEYARRQLRKLES